MYFFRFLSIVSNSSLTYLGLCSEHSDLRVGSDVVEDCCHDQVTLNTFVRILMFDLVTDVREKPSNSILTVPLKLPMTI